MGLDMSDFALSPQQDAILRFLDDGIGSAVILARAGCGKTFTIKQMVRMISAKCLGDVYVGAFNRKIADEVKSDISRMGIDWKTCAVNTAHGFGLGAVRKKWPNVRIDDKKVFNIIDDIAERHGKISQSLGKGRAFNHVRECRSQIAQLVSYAKQRGVGVTESSLEDSCRQETWWRIIEHYGIDDLPDNLPDDFGVDGVISLATEVLNISYIQDSDVIDFDDMVLAPITHNMRMWQRDFVFIDEAQDTNPARRAIFAKMLKPGGRLFAVGDDRQAINGFAGADADALDQIIERFGARTFPLTTTYRCPQAVIAVAQKIVPDIVAHESAPLGTVSSIVFDGGDDVSWFIGNAGPRAGDAVLCRTTAPLVDTAYAMIRHGIGAYVEGRDIGAGIIALATRWSRIKTIEALIVRLEKYRDTEIEKWTAKGRDDKAAAISDRVETLLTVTEWCRKSGKTTIVELTEEIRGMFADAGNDMPAHAPESGRGIRAKKNVDTTKLVTLSTIHKSKGREWDRVFFLHRSKCPSPWARREWEVEQEHNLIYVGVTRAKRELIFVDDMNA